jgi:hypothetical protein
MVETILVEMEEWVVLVVEMMAASPLVNRRQAVVEQEDILEMVVTAEALLIKENRMGLQV